MNNDDVVSEWLAKYNWLLQEAESTKMSSCIWVGLVEMYDGLTPDGKTKVLPILAQWLCSDDSGERSDAAVLIKHFTIRALKPDVLKLLARLEGEPGPVARDERERLQDILNPFE